MHSNPRTSSFDPRVRPHRLGGLGTRRVPRGSWWRLAAALFAVAGLFWSFLGPVGRPAGVQLAAAASDPIVAAAGDIACDPGVSVFRGGLGTATSCHEKYTSDLLVNGGITAVLALGDNQYYCASLTAFNQSYDPTWGRVRAITHPAPGNHEYMTSGGTGCTASNAGAAGYFNYFGSAAGTPGKGYYSYDVGTWHLIVLNSECGNVGGCKAGSAQYTWLQNDLATHTNYCTLAYWHIPLFSSGGRASSVSKPLWQLLYAFGADVVLNGHDHIYERFAPQDPNGVADPTTGIRQFTVGTGGDDHTSLNTLAVNSQVRNTDTFGVLELALHATSYTWQFVPESGKTFADGGTASCHAPGGSTATPTATSSGPTPTATATPTSGSGQSVTFLPQADAYVNSSSPTTDYGTSTALRADGSPDVHSYARFAVSGLNGASIARARLMFFMNSSSTSTLNALAVADNTWGETTINYGNMPALGSTIGVSGTLTTGAWVTIDVSSYVTGEGTYSFGVITPGSTAVGFASRESGGSAPQLIVDLGP